MKERSNKKKEEWPQREGMIRQKENCRGGNVKGGKGKGNKGKKETEIFRYNERTKR